MVTDRCPRYAYAPRCQPLLPRSSLTGPGQMDKRRMQLPVSSLSVQFHRMVIGRRFAAVLLPRLFGTNPRSHHKGATGRVRTGDQRLPFLCHCQLGQDIPTMATPGPRQGRRYWRSRARMALRLRYGPVDRYGPSVEMSFCCRIGSATATALRHRHYCRVTSNDVGRLDFSWLEENQSRS